MEKSRFSINVGSTQLGHLLPSQNLLSRFFAPVARYTQLVMAGRWILWALIVLVVFAIVYIASSNNNDDKSRLVFSSVKKVGDLQNVMKSPHYQGLDANNLPYSVMAEEAVQKDMQTVLLTSIKADMTDKKQKWLALHAGAGELQINSKHLTLTQGVNMFYEGGYEFNTDNAVVDIDKGTAKGDSPVQGQATFGTLEANSFEVLERGKIIRFNGSVRMKVYRE